MVTVGLLVGCPGPSGLRILQDPQLERTGKFAGKIKNYSPRNSAMKRPAW